MNEGPLRLHGYWRSGPSYRVRIALNLKGLPYEQVTHDLRKQEHLAASYMSFAPHGLVPTIEREGFILAQSPAILEWLDETHTEPPLMPSDVEGRAIVRAMAATIACEMHPLSNLRVLNALRTDFSATEPQILDWITRWFSSGFAALEQMIAEYGRGFAYGDAPTLADCHLVPQVYSAERWGVPLSPYPRVAAAAAKMLELEPTQAAHPDKQPDADPI